MVKKFFGIFLLGFLLSSVYAQQVSIAEIVENFDEYNGRQVTIQGIVVMGAGVLHNNILRAYVQDSSGKGIQVHNSSLNANINNAFIRGNWLQITGTVGTFDGMRQITSLTSYQILDTGYLPPYVELPISEALLHRVWEGTYVKISGIVTQISNPVGGGRDVILRDNEGNRIIIRVWDSTGLNVSNFSENLPLDVCGVIRVFQNSSQVTPGYVEDFIITQTKPVITNIDINPERPLTDQSITISAVIVDYDGFIESVKFYYRTGFQTGYIESNMPHIGGNVYRDTLPAFDTIHENREGEFIFSIVATDNEGNTVSSGERNISVLLRRPVSDIALVIHPKAYNIYEGDNVDISYFVKSGDVVVINIYNSEGKLVATPVNRITGSDDGINFFRWDGRDKDFRLVEPGLYICHMEVRDRTSGAIRNATTPIVIGTRLRRGR